MSAIGMPGASVRKTLFAASSMMPASQTTSTAAEPTVQRSRRDLSPGSAWMPTCRPIQYSVDEIDWMIVWRRMSVMPPLLSCSLDRFAEPKGADQHQNRDDDHRCAASYMPEPRVAASVAVLYSTRRGTYGT